MPLQETYLVDSLANPQPCDYASLDSLWTYPSVDEAVPVWTHQEEAVEELPPPPDWTTGIEGAHRIVNVGDNSGVLAICAGVFLLMIFSFRRSRKLLGVLWQELLGMRKRANLFDERTSNEASAIAMMAVQWSVCVGLLLYSAISIGMWGLVPQGLVNAENAFPDAGKLIGLAAAYYVVQVCAYSVLGFTFSNSDGSRMYLRGFTASQSILGFVLLVPALASIFYPSVAPMMIICGVFFYILARIIFIIKGFRIFYVNFGSLLYFILYLCTLEIIPLILVYKIALFLVKWPMIAL